MVALLLTACGQPVVIDQVAASPIVELFGEREGDFAGWAISGDGDVNGDGITDLLVGAYYAEGSPKVVIHKGEEDLPEGAAYLIHGPISSASALADADSKILGVNPNDTTARSLAMAGDINSDGYTDIIISAMHYDSVGHDNGAAYLIFGPTPPSVNLSDADLVIYGDDPTGHFASELDAAGDIDGDGFDDIIIGGQLDSGPDHTGKAAWYSGAALSTVAVGEALSSEKWAAASWISEQPGDYLGRCVAGSGDVNGDGFDDMVVSAPLHSGGGTSTGAAYLIFGPADLSGEIDLIADRAWYGGEAGSNLGSWLAAAGDVTGDGYADVLVGAYKEGDDEGSVYLVAGDDTPVLSIQEAEAKLLGMSKEGRFGFRFDGVSDLNFDGYDDVVIGAPTQSGWVSRQGFAYIVQGPISGVVEVGSISSQVLIGQGRDALFGFAVGVGDLDQDGIPDVAIGAPGAVNGGGSVSIFSGAGL